MTRDEFLIACFSSGYCSLAQAKEYAGDRQEFTDDDFIEVHRKAEAEHYRSTGDRMLGDGAYTTKRYYHDGESEGNR